MPLNLSQPTQAGVPAPPEQSDSMFWKALEVLNRPNAAIMGGASAALSGGDPLQAAYEGFTGQTQYSGQDVLGALGADPDSGWTRAGGLALDVVNPLDPLNYIGVGALTKAGKAARAAKGLGAVADIPDALRLGGTMAEQAAKGQRALLSFAGAPVVKDIPLSGSETALSLLGKAGSAVGDSTIGRGVQTLFGGKMGRFMANTGDIPEARNTIVDLQKELDRTSSLFKHGLDETVKPIAALNRDEESLMTEAIGLMQRGDISYQQATQQFVKPGTPGEARRMAAWESAPKLAGELQRITGSLEGTGLDAFMQEAGPFGHLPRVVAKGAPTSLGKKTFEPVAAGLSGPSANPLNYSLVQKSTEPISLETLTDEGRIAYHEMVAKGGIDKQGKSIFDRMADPLNKEEYDPAGIAAFMRKNRKTHAELNKAGLPYSYETRIGALYANIIDQALENVKADQLVRGIERTGIAQKWDDALHVGKDQLGQDLFIKIDQGRWKGDPIAIPRAYGDAFQRFQEAVAPSPRLGALATFFSNAMPEWARGIKPMSWWKGAAIFGRGTGYYARNFTTGVINNQVEGVGARYYGETFNNFLRPYFQGKLDDTFITLPGSGVRVNAKHVMDEYTARRLHGGGIPDIEIVQGEGRAAEVRRKVFQPFHKINEQVEVSIRMPLALKELDSTLAQAKRAGLQVPEVIGRVGADELMNPIIDAAWKNAQERVLAVHFDYEDLSEAEKYLRNFWIPFYTWTRKNVPRQTVAMFTEPGKYMKYARGYYNGVETSGLTLDDMPPWMRANFSIPIGQSEDGRNQFLDLTGFLPFMDVMEIGRVFAGREPGNPEDTFRSRLGRYFFTRANPILTESIEQTLQKEFLTGRDFGEVPKEIGGVQVSPSNAQLANLIPPLMEADRVNPTPYGAAGVLAGAGAGALRAGVPGAVVGGSLGLLAGTALSPEQTGLITQLGKGIGTFEGDRRPHRNEPDPMSRATRNVFGLKTYAADSDQANMSKNEKARLKGQLKSRARKARREGFTAEAEYFDKLAAEL